MLAFLTVADMVERTLDRPKAEADNYQHTAQRAPQVGKGGLDYSDQRLVW